MENEQSSQANDLSAAMRGAGRRRLEVACARSKTLSQYRTPG